MPPFQKHLSSGDPDKPVPYSCHVNSVASLRYATGLSTRVQQLMYCFRWRNAVGSGSLEIVCLLP